MYRLGYDIGGTFTDLVLLDERTGALQTTKVPSTPRVPAEGALEGLRRLTAQAGVDPSSIRYLVHGTTVALNAILEGKTARVGLVTTEGFRDIPEIGRLTRVPESGNPEAALYDTQYDKPKPLVPRYLRVGVRERVNAKGEIFVPLEEGAIAEAVERLRRWGVESVAVCFLHGYANPAHERMVADYLARHHPELGVSLASEVIPQYREYERVSTTVLNAAVMPILDRYLSDMEKRLGGAGFAAPLHIMQGVGGVMSSRAARVRSVHTAISGPVGGVLGGTFIGRHAGFSDLITLDMGGTSTDVSLVRAGEPEVTASGRLGGHPLSIPMIALNYIGAGGGSIAWLDPGGILKVGPRSAGADPGPVCYGKGGTEPTVTDANLVLGRLNADNFLGGEIGLDAEAAGRAIAELGRRMGLDMLEVAMGMIRVANANMMKAIRVISVEKGHDLRLFTLVAFGGAGPLHAGRLARELRIPTVVVPPEPGVLSAMGLLVADVKSDYVQTFLRETDKVDPEELDRLFATLEERAWAWLAEEGIPEGAREIARALDMRYIGQGHEITVPARGGRMDGGTLQDAVKGFHALHERLFTHAAPGEPTEVVTLRVLALGLIPKPRLAEAKGGNSRLEPVGGRELLFEGEDRFIRCPVFDRSLLGAGAEIGGPAVVEQRDSTTIIHPGQRARVDSFGNLILTWSDG